MSSPNQARLAATLASAASLELLRGLPRAVEWVELRADRVAGIDADRLRRDFGGRLLYSLRSRDRGGGGPDDRGERGPLLAAAAGRFDLVELEAERDLGSWLLARVPPERRLISWRGPAATPAALLARFESMAEVPARLYMLVPEARQAGEELAPLTLLRALGRTDVIAFAGGEAGFWTRLIAPRLGCPMTFGTLGATASPAARPTLTQLIRDYGLPDLPPARRTFGIVGRGALRSLSPRLHNAAYRALGLPAVYLPFGAESFSGFWRRLAVDDALGGFDLPLQGLTVVAPFKEAAVAAAGETPSSDVVRRAGAANFLRRRGDGSWEADSTDPQGVLDPLRRVGVDVRDRQAAVVGCGGAGRAIGAALDRAGARVVVVNRSPPRGREAAGRLGLTFVPLSDFDPGGFAIVVNATPVGREETDEPPFAVGRLPRDAVVVDLVYAAGATALAAAARERGLRLIDGREVLLAQTWHQLRAMTGRRLPLERLRSFLEP